MVKKNVLIPFIILLINSMVFGDTKQGLASVQKFEYEGVVYSAASQAKYSLTLNNNLIMKINLTIPVKLEKGSKNFNFIFYKNAGQHLAADTYIVLLNGKETGDKAHISINGSKCQILMVGDFKIDRIVVIFK